MPNIEINRKTGIIDIIGDCGAEWKGECEKIKVTKGKIVLKCDTELTKECPDMEKPSDIIEELSHFDPDKWDTHSMASMAGQVIQMGWAQMEHEDVATGAIEILTDSEYSAYYYGPDDSELYRVVLYGDEDWIDTALFELSERVRGQGNGVTDNPHLAKAVCDKLKKEGLACNFEVQEVLEPNDWKLFHVFLEGPPGGKAMSGCKKCGVPGGRPGKFEASGEIGEQLWNISLDPGTDDELGCSEDYGWYGLLIKTGIKDAQHAIVTVDSQGFVDYLAFKTEKEARDMWADQQAAFEKWSSETE